MSQWSKCEIDDENDGHIETTYFFENGMALKFVSQNERSDEPCKGRIEAGMLVFYKFKIISDKMEFKYIESHGIANNADMVQFFNDHNFCDHHDWTLKKSVVCTKNPEIIKILGKPGTIDNFKFQIKNGDLELLKPQKEVYKRMK